MTRVQTQPAATGNHKPAQDASDFDRMMSKPVGNDNVLSVREIFTNMDHTYRFAKALAMGCGLGSNEDASTKAMARIIIGAELGIGPAASVRGIHFIKERVSLSADLMVAMAQDEGWEFEIKHSEPPGQWCWVGATHPDPKKRPYDFRWTMEMAQKAGLVRGGGNWMTYPWDMLYARAASHVSRKVAPGRLMGIYTPDEAREMTPVPTGDAEARVPQSLAERMKAPPAESQLPQHPTEAEASQLPADEQAERVAKPATEPDVQGVTDSDVEAPPDAKPAPLNFPDPCTELQIVGIAAASAPAGMDPNDAKVRFRNWLRLATSKAWGKMSRDEQRRVFDFLTGGKFDWNPVEGAKPPAI